MKPVGVTANASSARAATGSAPSISEQLLAVDTAVLQKLLDIRTEQTRVETFRKRADELQSQVADAVRHRVLEDYAKREATLEQQVTALKPQVRKEYQKVRDLVNRITIAHEAARLDKEELEFRHAVGELDDAELAAQIERPSRLLDQCQKDLAEVDQVKARFLEAFRPGEVEEMETATPQPTETVSADMTFLAPVERLMPTGGATGSSPVTTLPGTDAPAPASVAPSGTTHTGTTSAAAPMDDRTRLADLSSLMAPPATAKQPPESGADRTMLLPLAALLVGDSASGGRPGGIPSEFRLGAANYIGRSADNQIPLARPGVSRKHALISVGPTGYSIKDLQSQNGTFVNGERITEVQLADGNTIDIGDVRLTFRWPWPRSTTSSRD